MTDQTGLMAFIKGCMARERAEAARLPEQLRTLMERQLRLLERVLDEHGPEPHQAGWPEPLCTGCLITTSWPCDFALHVAAIWREETGYRPEWGDALGAHPVGQGH